MPTRDRRQFVAQAAAQFIAQNFPDRELIVVDDGDDPIADAIPRDPRIRSIRLDRRVSLGAKRNLACDAARGDLVVHWDDDDWMAQWRLAYQVNALGVHAADVCGLTRLYFYDEQTRDAWLYTYPPGGLPWFAGGTLCYRKTVWRERPFGDIDEGEDTAWIRALPDARLLTLDDSTFYVARIHAGNRPRRLTGCAPFARCAPSLVEQVMRDKGRVTCQPR